LERLHDLVGSPVVLEHALQAAWTKSKKQMAPEQQSLEQNWNALQENQTQVDNLTELIASGQVSVAMLDLLNERAMKLKNLRDHLRREQQQLLSRLSPLERDFNATGLSHILRDFNRLRVNATPEELQRLLRWAVRKVDWQPDGQHRMQLFHLPKAPETVEASD
jgi:hypothetical protein